MRRAIQEGYTQEDLLAGGLVNRRGTADYFTRRLVFPLADARGAVRGFQARKLHDDDPLQAKYVNSAESDLFKKGDLLYGLNTARQPIAKQDRAVVVEGNTDVLALRQAGFEPVVASMGTALTAQQLRELNRLTKRLFLCFDSDAAGQEATLRGMELAVAQDFDVQIVCCRRERIPPTILLHSRNVCTRPSATRCIGCGCSMSAPSTRTLRPPRLRRFSIRCRTRPNTSMHAASRPISSPTLRRRPSRVRADPRTR